MHLTKYGSRMNLSGGSIEPPFGSSSVFFIGKFKKKIGCVRLPEWAELPEWTTGIDFNMQPLVLLLYYTPAIRSI